MKAFSSILLLAGAVMSSILGYYIVSAVLPTWMTFWAISTAFTYVGFIGTIIAEASK